MKIRYKLLFVSAIMWLALTSSAQNPTYKLVADVNGTAGKDFVVTIEWPANASYTNVTLDNAFIGVLYSEGTTLTHTTQSGAWVVDLNVSKSLINTVCGASLNVDDYAFVHYNLPTQHQFGNRTGGGSDTLFTIASSTFLSAGKIQLITNNSPPATVDSCMYANGVKNTGTIDPAFPSLSTGYDIVGTGGSLSLPIELLELKASWMDENALVQWTTASEENNSGFVLERSMDGMPFEVVSELIPSKGLNGNSNSIISYQFIDPVVKPRVAQEVYYRLTQIDFDGKMSQYGPAVLRVEDIALADLSVFPNPANEKVHITTTSRHVPGKESVRLRDMSGRLIVEKSSRDTENGWDINVGHLDRGFYFVEIQTGTTIRTKKIVVK